jgi:hypothetical protein
MQTAIGGFTQGIASRLWREMIPFRRTLASRDPISGVGFTGTDRTDEPKMPYPLVFKAGAVTARGDGQLHFKFIDVSVMIGVGSFDTALGASLSRFCRWAS